MFERYKPPSGPKKSEQGEIHKDGDVIESLNQNPDDADAYRELGDQLYAFKTRNDFSRLEQIADLATRLKAMRDLISIADSPQMGVVAGLAREALHNAVTEVEQMTDTPKKIVAILALSGMIEDEKQQTLWASLSEQDVAAYIEHLPPQELWQLSEMMHYGTEAQRRVVYNHVCNIPRDNFPVMMEHLKGIERFRKIAKASFFDRIQSGASKTLKKEFAAYTVEVLADFLHTPIDNDIAKTLDWLVNESHSTPRKVFCEAIEHYCEELLTSDKQEKAREDLSRLSNDLEDLARNSLTQRDTFRAMKLVIGRCLAKRRK